MSELADILGAVRAGVRVTVESNILPPLKVYGGQDDGKPGVFAGIGNALGLRGGVVVRNASGDVLARLGDPVKFEPGRAAVLILGALGVVGITVAIVRAVRR